MYALADCNNFFASCERVFRPELNGKPVIVLSNNDGCAVARSNEAKALGIKMSTSKICWISIRMSKSGIWDSLKVGIPTRYGKMQNNFGF